MKYRWMKPMYYQQSVCVCVSIVCSVWWMNRPPTHSQTHRQYLSFVVVSWSEAVSQSEIWAKSQQLFLVLGAGQTIRAQIYNSPMGAEACVSHWSTESLYFSLPFCWSLFSCLMSLWLDAPCFSPSLIPSLCFFLLLFLFSFDDTLLCNMCERLGLNRWNKTAAADIGHDFCSLSRNYTEKD